MKQPAWSVLQGTAVLLLCRFAVFLCSDVPYTAAHAKGMCIAALLEVAMVLPLLHFGALPAIPMPLLWLYRGYAVIWAANLAAMLVRTLTKLQQPHPVLFLLFLGIALLYLVPRPQAATARTAVILALTGCCILLLLPLSGGHTTKWLALYLPDQPAIAFLREFRLAGELGLMPLLLRHTTKSPDAPRKTLLGWAAIRGILLPLLVVYGTLQTGRLQAFQGNPFFLLLAHSAISDAVRLEGFWLLFVVCATTLAITFYLQHALPPAAHPLKATCLLLLPVGMLTFCFLRTGYAGEGLGIAAVLLGVCIPWLLRLAQSLQRLSKPQKERTLS